MEWYNACQEALNNVVKLYQGKETADIVQNKVLQVYIPFSGPMSILIRQSKIKLKLERLNLFNYFVYTFDENGFFYYSY